MSSEGIDSDSSTANSLTNICFLLSCCTFVLYDYYLTLPLEIVTIWHRDFNAGTALYILMRYTHLISNLLQILGLFYPFTPRGFSYIASAASVLQGISSISQITVFILRTYAISQRNVKVLVILGVFGLSIVGLGLYGGIKSGIQLINAQTPVASHVALLDFNSSISAASILVFVFDTLVYLFTIKHTYMWGRSLGQRIGNSVISRMYTDGTIYYTALLAINLMSIIFCFVDTKFIPGPHYITNIYQNDLGIVFTARLILNLKNVVGNRAGVDSTVFSSISFASLPLGNLGAPLEDETDCDFQ